MPTRPATADRPADQAVDGRHLRSRRTRAAVADAVLELLDRGELRPTAPMIAAASGVSLRTVFHHFEDLETLFAVVAERQFRRMEALIQSIPPDLPLNERVVRFTAQRARTLEAVTSVARAAALQEPFSDRVHVESERMRQLGREEVAATFAPELAALDTGDRDIAVAALAGAVSWRSWETLRAEARLDVDRAERGMRLLLRGALGELAARGVPAVVEPNLT